MLTKSTILGPRESRVVEVVCVEHGRWGGGQAHAGRGRRGAASVRYGLRASHAWAPDSEPAQHQVWQRVARFETGLVHTPTSSMVDHLDRAPALEVRRLPGQRGVIVGIGGVVAWGELFGSAAGLASKWAGILAAATLDGQLAPEAGTPSSDARRFARDWAALAPEEGWDADPLAAIVSKERQLSMSGIGHHNRLVHATVFNNAHPMMENA